MLTYFITFFLLCQAFKKKFIEKHDVISVEENEKMIIITTGETFDLNDFLWV